MFITTIISPSYTSLHGIHTHTQTYGLFHDWFLGFDLRFIYAGIWGDTTNLIPENSHRYEICQETDNIWEEQKSNFRIRYTSDLPASPCVLCAPCGENEKRVLCHGTYSGQCASCDAGKYLHVADATWSCKICPVNTYNMHKKQYMEECTQCQMHNSTSSAGSAAPTACTCLPGFFRDDSRCVECSENHFCALNTRSPCPANSSSVVLRFSIDNCTCVPGFRETG